MTGSTFKRCACRNPETGKQYGQSCPKLTQKRHGLWNVRQELPLREDGTRRTFRRSGYTSKNDAQADLDQIRTLLKIPSTDDAEGRVRIGDLLESVASGKEPIPDYEETKRKFGTGQSLTVHTTVGEWLELWLAGKKRLRKSGKDRYETDIRVHLEPRIGHLRLDRLRVQHLDEMFAGIAETNIEINDANIMRRAAIDELAAIPWKGAESRARRKALKETIAAMPPFRRITGPSTQSHIRATLRAALNDAIAQGYITFNPAQHVELEAAKRPKALVWTEERVEEWIRTGEKPSPVMVWTPEQAGQFLDFIAEDRLYALFHLITYRGLRRGEACGARKQDLNLQAMTLTIATQLVQDGWEVLESDPKTDSGARVVHLDEDTMDALRTHLAKQAADRLSWGEAWQDTGRIFTQENGEWLHPGWLTDYFERLVEASGLPPIRLHDLRHVAASLMLAAGVDVKIVSETLGHSDSRITRDIYQSVLPKVGAEAAEATARMVPRAASSKIARTAGLTSGSHAPAEIIAISGPATLDKEKAQVSG